MYSTGGTVVARPQNAGAREPLTAKLILFSSKSVQASVKRQYLTLWQILGLLRDGPGSRVSASAGQCDMIINVYLIQRYQSMTDYSSMSNLMERIVDSRK